MGAKTLIPRSSTPVKSEEEPTEVEISFENLTILQSYNLT